MTITSFRFLSLFALSIPIYYIIPKRIQWLALLGFSAAFFALSVPEPRTGVYLLVSALTAWACARLIEAARAKGRAGGAKLALAAGILVNAGILAALKYNGFLIGNYNRLTGSAVALPDWAVPMGVSFYSFALMGYLLDCCWGEVEAQKNPAKLCLYAGYYPILTSGPILSYRTMRQQLFEPHRFDYERVAFGMQRMLWGLFLKLVISGRLGTAVNAVYAEPEAYPGLFIWFAAGLFMLQLYTDFRGCMDIIAGASECYGVQLPENFRTPFFSRSVQEFWQRWHITLGAFMRDYVFYPIALSKPVSGLAACFKKASPTFAKALPAVIANLFVFLLVGLWHGINEHYVVWGLYNGVIIGMAVLLEPVSKALNRRFSFTSSQAFHVFRVLRTFLIVNIGWFFDRSASAGQAIALLRSLGDFRPEQLTLDFLSGNGLSAESMIILIGSGVFLFVLSLMAERGADIPEKLMQLPMPVRWTLIFVFVLCIVLFFDTGNTRTFMYAAF